MAIQGALGRALGVKVRAMQAAMVDSINLAALKLERTIVRHIQDQDLPWEPLKQATVDRKKREGLSPLILVATGTALEQVELVQVDGGPRDTNSTFFVGWTRQRMHPETDEPTANIMAVHEYGTDDNKIQARPVVQPSVDETQAWFRRDLAARMKRAAKR